MHRWIQTDHRAQQSSPEIGEEVDPTQQQATETEACKAQATVEVYAVTERCIHASYSASIKSSESWYKLSSRYNDKRDESGYQPLAAPLER